MRQFLAISLCLHLYTDSAGLKRKSAAQLPKPQGLALLSMCIGKDSASLIARHVTLIEHCNKMMNCSEIRKCKTGQGVPTRLSELRTGGCMSEAPDCTHTQKLHFPSPLAPNHPECALPQLPSPLVFGISTLKKKWACESSFQSSILRKIGQSQPLLVLCS